MSLRRLQGEGETGRVKVDQPSAPASHHAEPQPLPFVLPAEPP
jgi:hypothetical protein